MQQFLEKLLPVFIVTTARYFLIAGLAFVVFYLLLRNWFKHSKIQHRIATRKDLIREVLYSLQTSAILSIIGCLVLVTPFKHYTLVYDDINEYPYWYFIASIPLSLIVHDTYFYWMHRLLHHPALFKRTHLVHHQSVNPSPWASYSFHFIEAWTEGAVLVLIVMVMPIHPLAILWFVVGGFVINVYGHLGYEIAPLWLRRTWLFEVVNTSVHHNLHHSKFKGNYGLYFRVWDRLMGTEHPDYVKTYDKVQANRLAGKGNALPEAGVDSSLPEAGVAG